METADQAVDDAIRFRQSFGLRSDPAFVRATTEDSRYSTDAYGVPLSEGEVAEMFRRATIQSAMDAAIEHASGLPSFAGAYLDQRARGRPVFLFTKVEGSFHDELAALLPEHADVQIESAKLTEEELQTLQHRIETDVLGAMVGGSRVVQVGLDTQANVVEVGVTDLAKDTIGSLKNRYGESVRIVEARVAQSDACAGDVNNCRPIKGGLAINHSGGTPRECTSGFIVKRTDTGTLAVLTAGHCIQVHGGFNTAWYHDYEAYGRALYETWVPGGSGDADVGLTTIFSADVALMTNKNHVRRNNASTPASVTATASPVQGGQACRVGARSVPGHMCGLILNANQTNISEAGGLTMSVRRTARVNFDSTGGDSGGPVFFYPGGGTCCSPVTALGVHVHSEPDASSVDQGWFSPYSWGRSAYAALFPGGQTFNICLTAAC